MQSGDAHVSGKLWVKVRNHVLKKEDEYWAMVPAAGVDGVEDAAPIPEDFDSEDDLSFKTFRFRFKLGGQSAGVLEHHIRL